MKLQEAQRFRMHPLFSAMAEPSFERLLAHAFMHRWPVNSVIVEAGDAVDVDGATMVYILEEGVVQLFAHSGHRQTVLTFAEAPETLLLMPSMRGGRYPYSMAAVAECRALHLPVRELRPLLEIDPGLARSVIDLLAKETADLLYELRDQKLRTSAEKLALWIGRKAETQVSSGRIQLEVEKRLLASRLGMTPEYLTRSFEVLKRHGVLLQGRDIIIKDADKLSRFARDADQVDEALSG